MQYLQFCPTTGAPTRCPADERRSWWSRARSSFATSRASTGVARWRTKSECAYAVQVRADDTGRVWLEKNMLDGLKKWQAGVKVLLFVFI